ncbi:MAG: glycoside hydrolase family 78 protein [Tannerella sp.]|jgi:hypothetical protein|nr:glycoside hydrolase family 78 protein [Tannerella sp.]
MKRLFIGIWALFIALSMSAMDIFNLTVEYRNSPLALETAHPRFGWKLLADVQGDRQTAYRIVVSAAGKEIWNSGKMASDRSQLIPYGGKALQPSTRYRWQVTVWDAQGKATENEAYFETAPVFSANTKWIGAITREDAHLPEGRRDFHVPSLKNEKQRAVFEAIHPLALRSICLRRPFVINKPVEKAMAYVSGLGHYLFSVNGKRVSNDIFAPVWSDYDKTVYYNTYSVDSLLTGGENTVGILLGNGFYNTVGDRYHKLWVSFGPPTLFFELHIFYTDGSREIITSDERWKYDLSPITFNDIFGGEDYDARMEQKGWDKPAFDDRNWKPAVIQSSPKGIFRSQEMTAIRRMEHFGAVSMTKIDTSYVLDMGQNLSGYPSIKVFGKKGQTVKLTVGELLNRETGLVSQKSTGSPHTYTYTLKGEGIEEWHPEFSYYGFQYIQIDGADVLSSTGEDKPLLMDVKSCFIYNSTNEAGYFESSNELFNKVHNLIQNAVKSNMQAVFTDCPHREKLGWLEETHLNGPVLLYNYDMTRLFPKIMRDIADGQRSNGLIPSIVPEYVVFGDDFSDSPEWGSAGVIIPWMYYRFYGDNRLIIQYYDVMKKYVDYLGTKADNHILSHGLGDWYDYGDHPAGYSKNSPIEVSATSHYYYAARLTAKAAEMLHKSKDFKTYNTLALRIKEAFNNRFFNRETCQYANGSQFCNAVAIFMEIVEPQYKQAVLDNLKADIRQRGYRLTTGDVGNRYLFMALALNGENELMYKMHNHEEVPGYGYQVKMGVTTLTEQWDPNRGNSWNHFMMGQIDEWFFRSLAGIEPETPGFKTFTVQPQTVDDLTYVKASHKTLYGDIKVEWKRENGRFHLSVTVPVNTQASIVLPDGKKHKTGSGTYRFECPDLSFPEINNNTK